jgi:hypothetical protein
MSSSPVIHQGFAYAATDSNGKAKSEADYRSDFAAAKRLANTKNAFSSARVFTIVVSRIPSLFHGSAFSPPTSNPVLDPIFQPRFLQPFRRTQVFF